jgi:hypothetical protein
LDNLSDVVEDIFQGKDDFVRETRILLREKKYSESERSSEESNNTSNTGQPHG